MASFSRAAIAVSLLALAAAAAAAPAAAPAPAAPAPALTQAQADALVGVWEVQSGLSLSGNLFDDELKAAVVAGAAAGAPADLDAAFAAAAVEITGITLALVHADLATGILIGYAANTTVNATAGPGAAPIAQLKRYAGHAAPAPGGASVIFTLIQDDDQGEWRGEVGADGLMRIVREEGVEVWAPGGGALVDNMGASTLTLARTSADVAGALAVVAPLLPLKNNFAQAASGEAARRGLAAAAAAAALVAALAA
jgi:hypothetical protein